MTTPSIKMPEEQLSAANDDGIIFWDIELTGISSEPKARREDTSRDIQEFFDDVHTVTDADGKAKEYRNCKICAYVLPLLYVVENTNNCYAFTEKKVVHLLLSDSIQHCVVISSLPTRYVVNVPKQETPLTL
jgi:hypothetical protein